MKLAGLRVLNTRPANQAEELSRLLREQGAEVVELPLLTIEYLPISRELAEALGNARENDFLIFTSANAVRALFTQASDRLKQSISRLRIATVGQQTSSVVDSFGCVVSLVPREECAEALSESLLKVLSDDARCIFLKGDSAGDYLEQKLADRIQSFVVYRSIPAQVFTPPDGLGVLIFTSSLSAKTYFAALTDEMSVEQLNLPVIAVGSKTMQTLEELGAGNVRLAVESSAAGILSTLLAVHPCRD